jgi:cell division protein FtsB
MSPARRPSARKVVADSAHKARNGRKTIHLLLLFVASVLVVDALIGEKGLLETLRVREEFVGLDRSILDLRQENARLREEVRRLREDPQAIEEIARRELGLIRPGELLFIIRDSPSPVTRPQ